MKKLSNTGSSQAKVSLRSLPTKLGILATCFGWIGILGWGFNIQWLKSILPNLPAMQFNTAICLVLAGTALALWQQKSTATGKSAKSFFKLTVFSLTLLTVFITSLTLIEYGFKLDLGTDHLGQYFGQYLHSFGTDAQPPNSLATFDRIPANAAFCLLLIGVSLLLLSDRLSNIILAQVMAILVWLLSFLGLLSRLYNTIHFYADGASTGVSIHTAIALQCISVGILCTYPDVGLMRLVVGDRAGSAMTRQLLPFALILPPIMGGFCALGYHWNFYREEFGIALTNTLDVLLFTGLIGWNAYQLNRLDSRWKQAEQDLQQANYQLEQRVEERTIALKKAADELEMRVAERTSELQAINDRWHLEFLLRERATRLRKESEQRFRAIFDTSFQFIGLLTPAGILLEANQTALVFGGLQLADIVNRPFWEARWWTISPETQEQLKQAIAQAAAGEFVRYEVKVQGAGDTTTIIDFSLKPIFDETGKVKLLIPEGRDISDRKRMEDRLALQSTIVKNMAEGVCLVRATDKQIVYVNPKFEKMFGYEPGELINQPVRVVNYADDQTSFEAIAQDITAQIEQRGEAVYEIQNRKKDGTPFWCRAHISIFDHPIYGTVFVAVQADITRQKQAELELQQQRDLLETVYDESTDALFLVDPDTLLTIDCNRRAIELFEADSKESLIGIEGRTLQHRPFTEEEVVEIAAEIRKKSYWSLELEYVTRQGNLFLGNIAAKTVKIAEQSVNLVRVTDITNRKRTEAALRESQNKYQTLFNILPIGISITDKTGQIIEANPASEEILGLNRSEHTHRKYDAPDWQIVRPDRTPMPPEEFASVRALTENRFITNIEKGIVHPDGSIHWMNVSAAPIPLENYGVAIAYIDITKRKQAEIALHRYERMITATTDSMCLIDRNYTYQVVNAAYLAWHQRSSDQIVGHTISQILGVEVFETQIKPQFDRSLAGETCQYELWVDYPQGRKFVSVTSNPYYELDQSISGVVVSLRDITDSKHTEEALRLSEKRLQLALEASGEGLWDWYVETGEVYLDDRYQEMLGYQPGELEPATLADWERWIHPDDRTWAADLLQAHLQDSSIEFAFDYRIRTKTGEWKWIADYGKVVMRDAAGNPLRMIGTHKDITDRKLAEQALRASEERYRAIVEDQTELICRFLPDGTILFVNAAYCRYFGLQATDLIGQTYQPVVYEEDQAYVTQMVQSMSRENPTVLIENRVVVCDQIRWTQWSNRMISDEQGYLIEFQSVGRDITDRKVVEIELKRAKEAAELASQAKSMFLANMSHELRTPLNVILGFTQVLRRDTTLLPDHHETIQIIHRSGEHLLNLINDILDLSKIEAGRITLETSSVDLFTLLRSLQDMLAHRAESKGLQLHFEVAPNVPQYITIDTQKLRQILLNLLSNAIKFTDEGSVKLRVGLAEQKRAEEQQQETSSLIQASFHHPLKSQSPSFSPSLSHTLSFEIEDTGIGIAKDEINSIFDAFVQSCSTDKMPEGTGLGLTITLRFVELMGGDLSVKSRLGQGSLFRVEIPVQLAEAKDILPLPAHRQVARLAIGQPSYRILVVDDQLDNRLLLVRLMTQLGFEVREATNGQEAVALWREWHPHLIWMDIRMPIMNGYEATRLIQEDPERSPTKIIALTAYASSSDRTIAIAAGCDDYISKPFQEEELLAKMAIHLGLQYEYADTPSPFSADEVFDPQSKDVRLTADSLSIMPPEWIAALHQAAINCDDEEVSRLIIQIPHNHASLASSLNYLVRDYQFPKILQLTQPFITHPNH